MKTLVTLLARPARRRWPKRRPRIRRLRRRRRMSSGLRRPTLMNWPRRCAANIRPCRRPGRAPTRRPQVSAPCGPGTTRRPSWGHGRPGRHARERGGLDLRRRAEAPAFRQAQLRPARGPRRTLDGDGQRRVPIPSPAPGAGQSRVSDRAGGRGRGHRPARPGLAGNDHPDDGRQVSRERSHAGRGAATPERARQAGYPTRDGPRPAHPRAGQPESDAESRLAFPLAYSGTSLPGRPGRLQPEARGLRDQIRTQDRDAAPANQTGRGRGRLDPPPALPDINAGLEARNYTGDGSFRQGILLFSMPVPWVNAGKYRSESPARRSEAQSRRIGPG